MTPIITMLLLYNYFTQREEEYSQSSTTDGLIKRGLYTPCCLLKYT